MSRPRMKKRVDEKHQHSNKLFTIKHNVSSRFNEITDNTFSFKITFFYVWETILMLHKEMRLIRFFQVNLK